MASTFSCEELSGEDQVEYDKVWLAAYDGELDVLKEGLDERPHLLNVQHPESKQTLLLRKL